jgi:hypothetical protein
MVRRKAASQSEIIFSHLGKAGATLYLRPRYRLHTSGLSRRLLAGP